MAGGGGIGGELARRYAREGAIVVLGDIDLDATSEVVDEILEAGGQAISSRTQRSAKWCIAIRANRVGPTVLRTTLTEITESMFLKR